MLVIGCRGNTPCLVTSWSFLKAAGAGLASPGRLVLRKKQAGGTGTVPLRMWAWQAAPKHHQDALGAACTASSAWSLVCKARTTVPFSLALLIDRTVILYLVLPGPFSVLKSFYSLASEVALFCNCHCYPMMFSRMFQVKHQGTVWKWGWTDLGKQSILCFTLFLVGRSGWWWWQKGRFLTGAWKQDSQTQSKFTQVPLLPQMLSKSSLDWRWRR